MVHETDPVPSDSRVVGKTWAKANKDGSPDRRFANNHQIPIAEYGELGFTTASGLREEFLISNFERSTRFAEDWSKFANGASQSDATRDSTATLVKALERCVAATRTFLEGLLPTAGESTVTNEAFDDYMETAKQLQAAAADYMENGNLKRGAKSKSVAASGAMNDADF